jgi:hypothetical protein
LQPALADAVKRQALANAVRIREMGHARWLVRRFLFFAEPEAPDAAKDFGRLPSMEKLRSGGRQKSRG